jgi:hypothetical protein
MLSRHKTELYYTISEVMLAKYNNILAPGFRTGGQMGFKGLIL